MKLVDGWQWPDHEEHMLDWIANPKNRVIIHDRPAYQGRKQLAAIKLVPLSRRRTAIDVGAHIGLWSFNLARWFGKVEAFEPVAAHRACFAMNIGDDNLRFHNVTLHPYALGDHEDMVHVRTTDTSSGDSWIKGKGDVPMCTLDSFKIADVDFLKIDCEGYEELVLRGAEQTVKGSWPVICVEQKRDMATKFGLRPQGAITLLRSWGYKVAIEISGDYLMVHL